MVDNNGIPEIERLLNLLRSEQAQDRVFASYKIDYLAKEGECGDIILKEPFDIFTTTVHDSNARVRQNTLWILRSLAYHGYSEEVVRSGILPHVIASLEDDEATVRAAAAWFLAVLAEEGQGSAVIDSSAIESCIRLVHDADAVVQGYAALALDRIAFYASPAPIVQHGGVAALLDLLGSGDERVRVRTLWALWSIANRGYADAISRTDTALSLLKKSAEDRNLEIRRAAISIIGELPAGT